MFVLQSGAVLSGLTIGVETQPVVRRVKEVEIVEEI